MKMIHDKNYLYFSKICFKFNNETNFVKKIHIDIYLKTVIWRDCYKTSKTQ